MVRELREHRLMRISLALAVAILASSLAAASDNPAETRAVSEPLSRASSQSKRLSKFDYLVLASMADSRQPFAMAGYRDGGAADGSTAVNVFGHPINKGKLQCHL
jgi:hypothetical protein